MSGFPVGFPEINHPLHCLGVPCFAVGFLSSKTPSDDMINNCGVYV